jgi:hypothetical protein
LLDFHIEVSGKTVAGRLLFSGGLAFPDLRKWSQFPAVRESGEISKGFELPRRQALLGCLRLDWE